MAAPVWDGPSDSQSQRRKLSPIALRFVWFHTAAVQQFPLGRDISMCHESDMTIAPRTPWPTTFPDVIVHSTVSQRDALPEYAAAKSGDADAALTVAVLLIGNSAVADIVLLIAGRDVTLIPVVAEEAAGFNAIPDAMAQVLGRELDARVASGSIVQSNKVGHTRAPSFQRLVTPPAFDGPVDPGRLYLLIDDHVGLGGTFANLRGHICGRGGEVIGMTALTESWRARTICLQSETKNMLWDKHGKALDDLWQVQFGYGIECITELEAQILCRQPSVAAIEDFLAKAAIEARGRGLSPAV